MRFRLVGVERVTCALCNGGGCVECFQTGKTYGDAVTFEVEAGDSLPPTVHWPWGKPSWSAVTEFRKRGLIPQSVVRVDL